LNRKLLKVDLERGKRGIIHRRGKGKGGAIRRLLRTGGKRGTAYRHHPETGGFCRPTVIELVREKKNAPPAAGNTKRKRRGNRPCLWSRRKEDKLDDRSTDGTCSRDNGGIKKSSSVLTKRPRSPLIFCEKGKEKA